MQNKACGVRHKLNLYVGSPVTVAYGMSEDALELSQSQRWRWMEMVHQVQSFLRVTTDEEPEK